MITLSKHKLENLIIVFLIAVFLIVSVITVYVQLQPRYVVPDIYFEPNRPIYNIPLA